MLSPPSGAISIFDPIPYRTHSATSEVAKGRCELIWGEEIGIISLLPIDLSSVSFCKGI